VGGLDTFQPYIRDYVETFRNRSLSTSKWKKHLLQYFSTNQSASEALNKVDFQAWLYGEGLVRLALASSRLLNREQELPVKIKYDTSLADAAYALAKRWDEARSGSTAQFSSKDLDDFNSSQIGASLSQLIYMSDLNI
jgi:leukotriene-A4 hydrolase